MPEERDIQKEILNWNTRIEKGIEKRQEEEEEAKKNYEAVYGDLSPYKEDIVADKTVEEERYRHFKTLAFLKTELPNLMFESPEIFLKHKKQGLARQELIVVQERTRKTQEEVQRIYTEMEGYEDEVEMGLADAYCWYAASKTTFAPLYVENPEAGQPIIMDGYQTQEIQPDWKLSDLAFQRSRVCPFKMFFDPKCKGNPNKGAFLGEEIDTDLEQIKADALYDEDEVNRLGDFLRLKDRNKDREDWEIEVTLYEVYNLLDDTMFVLAKDYKDDYLRKPTSTRMMGIEKHPYRILRLMGRPGEVYPFPEVSNLRRKQVAMNDLGEWAHEWAEKQRPVIGIDKTKVPDENQRKKIGDGYSDKIEMKQGGAFAAIPDLPDNVSHKEYREMLQNDFDEDAGQTTTERSGTESKEFAIQFEIAQLKGQARESRKVKKVKRWLTGDIENVLKLMKANLPEDFTMPSGFNIAELDPDVDIDIDIESKTPKNRAIERKQLGEWLGFLPELKFVPEFNESYANTFDSIRDKDIIAKGLTKVLDLTAQIEQLQEALKAKDGTKVSVSLTPELLKYFTTEQQEYLSKLIAAKILQSLGGEAGGISGEEEGGGNGGRPKPAESVAAGTEGIEPDTTGVPEG